uniref:Uncharacterized protein n=1 Tax=viral metagenome TaxID=1070528 RepID=A0A6M3LSD8_9ZZZZ
MKIEIPDLLYERIEKVLDKLAELGYGDRYPTEDEIVSVIEREVEQLENEL